MGGGVDLNQKVSIKSIFHLVVLIINNYKIFSLFCIICIDTNGRKTTLVTLPSRNIFIISPQVRQ